LVVIFRGRSTRRTGSKSDSKPKRSVAWRTAHDVRIAKHYLKRTEMQHGASNNQIIAIWEIACKSQMFIYHQIVHRPQIHLTCEFLWWKKRKKRD